MRAFDSIQCKRSSGACIPASFWSTPIFIFIFDEIYELYHKYNILLYYLCQIIFCYIVENLLMCPTDLTPYVMDEVDHKTIHPAL